ncbi:nitrate reductase alpha subunit [Mesorhizobium sp. YL-MeA3-2017]|jgi:nitrate reductase alpha subunit|uniref:nitrate reductase subunit alpha n=1 Tax=Mesorhizobium sp. YL-MeA3-2017 TaxID=3042284 RepID=UPI0015CBF8A1|nr:nitrate reductase subunit alpha [Mesorhizobium sp. YL-MeA3-2017]MDQ0333482.1 nitrate reductase alpha subunit [Mesorhizobium sp. YL-MeA3-2017]
MSHFLERLTYLSRKRESFAEGHGELRDEDRMWEEGYRQRWQHDKIVRSTHGVNCTGSCSWKIYVKSGVVTWETQQTDYPRTRPGMPNHEPRGCSRGASYSWYLYSASRIKYPLVRGRLIKAWREARKALAPVEAWASIVGNVDIAKSYKSMRGRGGFIRSTWDEVSEIIAASNVHTIKKWGPDRVVGFSPIPAMSMVSYASGARYLSLIGGTLLSFYDWYCDLPPSSPQTWGEQTDVPESADWYNSGYIIAWGSNVPQTRTPDAHFFVEARYNGTKVVAITPDYAEVAKLSDLWLHPKQGTDAALAMAMGHVILKEFFLDRQVPYFQDYTRRYTDMPMLVRLRQDGERWIPDRYVRQSDLVDVPKADRADWKTVAIAEETGDLVIPQGSSGYRWPGDDGAPGRWNLEPKDGETGEDILLALSVIDRRDEVVPVAFPYFGGKLHDHFPENDQGGDVLLRNVPVRRVVLADGEARIATVFDLLCANYGLDRGLGGACATSFEDDVPYTPAWQQSITGVAADKAIALARGFADNAEKTKGRSMVIIGAGMNHWYHQDMGYRSIINVLMMCGTVGVSGGGWAHYVGQEKLRPQTGWTMLAFALDWVRPPRQMNGTSFFYAHSDQWRYEKLDVSELLSPLADPAAYRGSIIDLNVRAERMGWLPSAPQLAVNPLTLVTEADRAGVPVKDHVVAGLKSGSLQMACEDPDNPINFPRNLFIWRSNLFGSSGKGHEYFLRHFLGTRHGLQGKDLGEMDGLKPEEVAWRDPAPEGKLDLVVTLDFRMSTSCLYSDVVLPTATWYEKNDLNTSDMHPFIHPLSTAVDPVWESRSDWETYKTIAKRFSELAEGHLGVERDVVLTPIQHDTPSELAQPYEVKDWKKGECDLIPGITAPQITVVERDYPNTYRRFTSLGPLADKLGNGGKGIGWNTELEVKGLGDLNYRVNDGGPTQGRPRIETDIDAAEVIMYLAPETNGEVAVKAWEALGAITGRDHTHLARMREDEKIRFRDIQAQPRKIISSPTWSGIESEHVSYTAGYTNVNELIPWRTITGRQQFYQDHRWFRDFGESFAVYRPPVDTRTVSEMLGKKSNGEAEIVLNFITPHQKWGIHSTYTDNLLMLTLSRGGPIVWLSEADARRAGIVDNDWIELFNLNGAIAARAVVSQRVHEGMCMMYHAQEKIVNVPGSQITGLRGGIHNSVTRTVLKPTHMVGGYAQLSYGFNYYGTVGSNRDEFVIVRKLNEIDWLDHSNPVDRAVEETAS